MKKKTSIKSYGWYLHAGIVVALIAVGIFLLLRYIAYSDFSLTVLSYSEPQQVLKNLKKDELLKGQVILGQFRAQSDYLGIVAIRFNTFERKNDDVIVFRIRESGNKDWYSQKEYRTTLSDEELYNFGFPIIEGSKGKIYDFEIISTRGKRGDAIALSTTSPIVVTKYKYPKEVLLQDKKLIVSFLFHKALNELQNIDIIFFSLVFFLPALWYIVHISPQKKLLTIFLASTLALIIVDIFFIKKMQDEAIVILAGAVYVSKGGKNKSNILFLLGFIVLLVTALLYASKYYESAVNAASWTFIFFTLGLLSHLATIRKPRRTNS